MILLISLLREEFLEMKDKIISLEAENRFMFVSLLP